MINFDSLPTESPNQLPAPGVYLATILEAEMKQPKDTSKPEYMNLKLQLFDAAGKSSGTVYDIIAESDSSVIQFKLARFVRACGIPLTGQMELKDLCKLVSSKIVAGLKVAVDIKIDPGKNGYADKAVVDLFSRQAYYLESEFAEVHSLVNPSEEMISAIAAVPDGVTEEAIPFTAEY